MSRKVCRRRHYALVNPVALAISGATITTEADLDTLRMRELSAIDAFATGTAQPAQFRDLCDLLNVTQTFAETGTGPEALPACEALEAALLRAKEQHEATGTMQLAGDDLKAARDVFEYHDLQRSSVDRSSYERAIARTRNKIRSSHPDVRVLV